MIQPSAIQWFKIYAVLVGLLNLLVFAGITAISVLIFMEGLEDGETVVTAISLFFGGIFSLLSGIGHMIALKMKRQQWGYVYGIIVIGLGLMSCATWPATVPLLIAWLKPEMKAWFSDASDENQ